MARLWGDGMSPVPFPALRHFVASEFQHPELVDARNLPYEGDGLPRRGVEADPALRVTRRLERPPESR